MIASNPPQGGLATAEKERAEADFPWNGSSTGGLSLRTACSFFLSATIANLFVVLVGDRWLVAALLAAVIFMALLIGWTNIQLGFPGQAG